MTIDKVNKNISDSIVLLGPSGVGKSLVASTLSKKVDTPLLDIDDIIAFIDSELSDTLSMDQDKQKSFIEAEISDLKKLKRDTPLTDEEDKIENSLVYELVDLYNYYHQLLGGFEKFYKPYYDYYKATQKHMSMFDEVYHLNKLTMDILERIYATTDRPYIISPPGSFGWSTNNPLRYRMRLLQDTKIEPFLKLSKSVLLEPGVDYSLRTPTDDSSVNSILFLRHLDSYHKNADVVISTNSLFSDPNNDFLKQRTWLNVRETMTKRRLKNMGEISSICDQIIAMTKYKNNDNEYTL